MRISEIKPGMWVAVPAPHALLQATREGMSALPAKVIAIGNFRMKADRGCVPEILDDHFRQTVHVQRLNISTWDNKQRRELFGIGFRQMVPMSLSAPGMPLGLKLTSKRLQWTDTVLEAAQVAMPWEQFVNQHIELREGMATIEAMSQRRDAILMELASFSVDKGLAQPSSPWVPNGGQIRFTAAVQFDDLRKTVRGKALLAELLDIDAKLNCAC